jgi:FkbM family methyltransferase
MIRLSDISSNTFLGKTLRKFLRIVPKHWAMPIVQGPLRGAKWIVGAQTHGMWLGSYESAKQLAIAEMLQLGQVFYDIGANTGFFSLLGSKKVGSNGKVIAVEPLSRNIEFIKQHARINNVSNIVVLERAISDYDGVARFSLDGYSTSKISEEGELEVRVSTLDTLVQEIGAIPNVLKVDIEGAELNLIHGASTTLRVHKPIMFMAVHSEEIFRGLSQTLSFFGYVMMHLDKTEIKEKYCSEVLLMPSN